MPTALIIGSTSDIGYAIAKKYASSGFNIQLAGRDLQSLESLRSDVIVRYQVNCTVHRFEADDFDSHKTFYASLPVSPDLCFYVIGYLTDNDKAFHDWEESAKIIHANFSGAVSILNIIAADFESRKAGKIVGISSVAGNRGRQSNFIYGSAKAGFTAYLSGIRNRLYHSGVHVMTVLPGFVYTKMTEHLNLPKMLTAKPEQVATRIFNGLEKNNNVLYVKWFWRWIMFVIGCIPEFIFKKKKL